MQDNASSDALLVQKFLTGDEASFALLVKIHLSRVYTLALRITGNAHDAEDVTQQTFIKAWKNIRRYDATKKFTTWILAIAHNTAIDHLRKKRGIPFSNFDNLDGKNSILETAEDILPLPDEIFDTQELGGRLACALDTLSQSERAIITLHHEQDITFDEMAIIMGKSRNTLKSQYRRSLVKLRSALLASKAV